MVDFIISAFTDEFSPMLEEQIMSLKKHNFSHIELRSINGRDISSFNENEIRIISRKLEFDEVDVSGIGSPIGRVSINDDFNLQLEQFKKTVEIANILSTTQIRISSFFIPDNHNYEDYHNEVVERLGILAEYSKKQNVFCCLENEKGSYADTSNRIISINKDLNGYLKFIFNPANTVLVCEDCFEFYLEICNLIDYFYIKDALTDATLVPIGNGVCDIAKILSHYHNNISKTSVMLTLQPGLFISNDDVEYHYKNETIAFDTAIDALKSTLKKEGFSYF